jgi:uncharacterized membrane protein
MKPYLTVGLTVLAGAALLEAALIPGLVVGGAAILAPKMLPGLRRRLRPAFGGGQTRRRPGAATAASSPQPAAEAAVANPAGLGIKQAIAKTITFRVIVTTLDFTSNYVVIGEVSTAAGLSTFNLIAGPLLYLGHETAWNYLGGPAETEIDIGRVFAGRQNQSAAPAKGLTISRALAKTITFRTIATVVDFTTIYVVVGSAATAAGLSAFGFVLGPFVYYGHEWLWDRYGGSPKPRALPPPQGLSPAAA